MFFIVIKRLRYNVNGYVTTNFSISDFEKKTYGASYG